MMVYPLVICYIAIENNLFIVDLPSNNSMVIFQSYVTNYQRVYCTTWQSEKNMENLDMARSTSKFLTTRLLRLKYIHPPIHPHIHPYCINLIYCIQGGAP